MGELEVGPRSEHGLAHVLPPRDLTPDKWVDQAWQLLAATNLGIAVDEPDWLDDPALTRHTITSPRLLDPFRTWNAGRPYSEQIKPNSFMLVAHVAPLGEPPGVDPQRLRLVAPYTADRSAWESLRFRNLYDPSGPDYRITTRRWDNTEGPRPADLVEVTTYRQLLRRYQDHPEAKYASADAPGVRGIGWLERLSVRPRHLTTIGKESNKLDDVQAGLYGAADEILTEYGRDDPELEHAVAALAHLSGREVQRVTGVDRRTIDRVRQRGAASPRVRAAILAGALAAHNASNARPRQNPRVLPPRATTRTWSAPPGDPAMARRGR